jgi:hypothetical protein
MPAPFPPPDRGTTPTPPPPPRPPPRSDLSGHALTVSANLAKLLQLPKLRYVRLPNGMPLDLGDPAFQEFFSQAQYTGGPRGGGRHGPTPPRLLGAPGRDRAAAGRLCFGAAGRGTVLKGPGAAGAASQAGPR